MECATPRGGCQGLRVLLLLVYRNVMANCSVKMSPPNWSVKMSRVFCEGGSPLEVRRAAQLWDGVARAARAAIREARPAVQDCSARLTVRSELKRLDPDAR